MRLINLVLQGPPFVAKARTILTQVPKAGALPAPSDGATGGDAADTAKKGATGAVGGPPKTVVRMPVYGLDLATAHVGQHIPSDVEMTIDPSIKNGA